MYSIEQHCQRRAQFYRAIPDFWADLYDAEYALLDYHMLTEEEEEQIRTATNRIGHLYRKTAKLLRQLSDETLRLLGFHQEELPFLRIPVLPAETVIARADLVHVGGTFKLIELNADTPTFIRETFDINERVASFFHLLSPNKGEVRYVAEAVRYAIWQSYCLLHRDGEPYVESAIGVFAAVESGTGAYLGAVRGRESVFHGRGAPMDFRTFSSDLFRRRVFS
ncbi:Glutathionylspermidine synthase [Parageobacillus caldoxylosilyticus]|jgi:hypothetical protein|nr:Glutathionylspermidine synthase [Parageobacillus caldoxylosilyticus]QXJ40611.1 Glutathionylspermidine synthase [Parageobacillus caldoxylosilyticus]